jgi:nucleotide-binding universal stress UspA family protein
MTTTLRHSGDQPGKLVRIPQVQAGHIGTGRARATVAYTNVVVGTDGSATAERAVAGAAEIAVEHEARLIIVTAFKRQGDELASRPEVPDDIRWALTDEHQAEELAARGRKAADLAGVKQTVTRAIPGSPADVILEAVDDFGADLIVVGSKGLTGAAGIVLGSVASSVAHHAPCDVMIIRTND